MKSCYWALDSDGFAWETSCGGLFVINDGTPRENDMEFCPYCGKRLVEKNESPEPTPPDEAKP